jgi:hypothetical protein
MLIKLLFLVLYLLKYLLIGTLITTILAFVFPPAAFIVGFLFLVGFIPAGWGDTKKKWENLNLSKSLKIAKYEIEGFDKAIRETKRNMG